MEPDQRKDFERRKELAGKLSSVMAHPDWPLVLQLIQEEVDMHARKAKDVEFRHDPSQYANIVRALDNADAVGALLSKFDAIILRGKEARERLEKADGQPGTGQ